MLSRRRLAQSGFAIAVAGMALIRQARADFISAPDVVVYCDPAVAAAIRMVGADFRARTGVPIRVFASPGTLQIELMARGTRTDMLVTLTRQMDAAAARMVVKPETRRGSWRDEVVLAARDAPVATAPADAKLVTRLLGDGRLAVIDPVAADRMDGPAVVNRLGWGDATRGRLDGMATGQEVAFVIESGANPVGMLHRSDLAGHRSLAVVATVGDAAPPADYQAAIGRNVLSRYAVAFLDYLSGPEATERLRGLGLETIR